MTRLNTSPLFPVLKQLCELLRLRLHLSPDGKVLTIANTVTGGYVELLKSDLGNLDDELRKIFTSMKDSTK